jgi:hypothetical protein
VGYCWSYLANQRVDVTTQLMMPQHYFARHVSVIKDPIELIYFIKRKENIGKEAILACNLGDDADDGKFNQKVRLRQIKNGNLIEIRVGGESLDDANVCMNALKNSIFSMLMIEIDSLHSSLSALEDVNTRRLEEIKEEYGANTELTGLISQEVATVLTTLKDIKESKYMDKYYSQIKFTDNTVEKYTFYLRQYNYYLYSAFILFFVQKILHYLIRLKPKFN